jgi:hypothetical protein
VSAYVPPLFTAIRKSPALAAKAAEAGTESSDGPASAPQARTQQPGAAAAEAAAAPVSETNDAPSERATFGQIVIAAAVLGAIVCAAPFLAGVQNIMGLVIIGIGLYEAWKFNKRREWSISGPHAIATAPTPAS